MRGNSKAAVTDLALFGGAKAMAEPLHVGRPNIGERADFLDRVNDILDRRWLTNAGKNVAELERRIAGRIGVKHCIAMCNGTVALEIAIRALELEGEVIVPSFTFVATAHALQWQEITPVFCDIDPVNLTIDPAQITRMVTPRTTGIIGVHLWGRPCDTDAIDIVAATHGLKVLYDAAHAFECSHRGKMIGNFGEAEVFSFHATKFFNTMEGGAVVTNNDKLAAKIRLMKNFGFAGYDNVIYIGTNGKMNEVCAAMGLTNLSKLEEFIAINRRNYHAYREELEGVPGIRVVAFNEAEKCNFQYVPVIVDERDCGIGRDRMIQLLHAENILARRYFYPGCHRMQPYKALFPHAGLMLPETEALSQRIMLLPTGTTMDLSQVGTICALLRQFVQWAPEINERLDRKQRKIAAIRA